MVIHYFMARRSNQSLNQLANCTHSQETAITESQARLENLKGILSVINFFQQSLNILKVHDRSNSSTSQKEGFKSITPH